MKVYVHYDSSGTIHGLTAADAPANRMPMLVPTAGLFVAEVEGAIPGWKQKAGEPDLKKLSEIAKNLRVATPTPRCKLVRK